jgi:hypothetical protein
LSITLSGRLLSDTGNGVNGATVKAIPVGSNTPDDTTTTAAHPVTAEAGWWTFTTLDEDTIYKIQVEYSGHVRQFHGLSAVQFNELTIGTKTFNVQDDGTVTMRYETAPLDGAAVDSPTIVLTGAYDSNPIGGALTVADLSMKIKNVVATDGTYKVSFLDNADAEKGYISSAGVIGGTSIAVTSIVASTIGPAADKQHTLPNVASDTIALLAAEQTLTDKTLTTPVIASMYQDAGKTKLMSLPNTASDTLVSLNAEQTLTLKTLTTPVIASFYQDAGKTKLMTVPAVASDTLVTLAATQNLSGKTFTDTTAFQVAVNVTDYVTALGGVHVGGTSDPGTDNLVVDGTSTLTGTIGVGTAPIGYMGARIALVRELPTGDSTRQYGLSATSSIDKIASATTAQSSVGIAGYGSISAANTINWTAPVTDIWSPGGGIVGVYGKTAVAAGATGTVTAATSIFADAAYAGMEVTTHYGVYIATPAVTAPATVGTIWGLYVEDGTLNRVPRLNIGGVTNPGDNNLLVAGTIATGAGSGWTLGGYTADAVDSATNGYVTITIGGTSYKLLTRA